MYIYIIFKVSILYLGKKKSQLFTYNEIVKNNKGIFAKQYPRQHDENTNHYICKVFTGEQLRKFFSSKLDMVINYEHPLPALETEIGYRNYIPDIYIEFVSDKEEKVYIAIIEINGKIHYASKKQYQKNKLRRETILNYFKNEYKDQINPNYEIVFSYVVFDTEDFLYHKFDFFLEIFQEKFSKGGVYPEFSAYERYLLKG